MAFSTKLVPYEGNTVYVSGGSSVVKTLVCILENAVFQLKQKIQSKPYRPQLKMFLDASASLKLLLSMNSIQTPTEYSHSL